MRMCRRMGMGFRSSFGEFLLSLCLGIICGGCMGCIGGILFCAGSY